MCDRILVLGSNPGHIAAEVPVPLPQPRNRLDLAFHVIVDEIYSILTIAYGQYDRGAERDPWRSGAATARCLGQPNWRVHRDVGLTDLWRSCRLGRDSPAAVSSNQRPFRDCCGTACFGVRRTRRRRDQADRGGARLRAERDRRGASAFSASISSASSRSPLIFAGCSMSARDTGHRGRASTSSSRTICTERGREDAAGCHRLGPVRRAVRL